MANPPNRSLYVRYVDITLCYSLFFIVNTLRQAVQQMSAQKRPRFAHQPK
jgi:hypothetical protein